MSPFVFLFFWILQTPGSTGRVHSGGEKKIKKHIAFCWEKNKNYETQCILLENFYKLWSTVHSGGESFKIIKHSVVC